MLENCIFDEINFPNNGWVNVYLRKYDYAQVYGLTHETREKAQKVYGAENVIYRIKVTLKNS